MTELIHFGYTHENTPHNPNSGPLRWLHKLCRIDFLIKSQFAYPHRGAQRFPLRNTKANWELVKLKLLK